MGLPDKPPLKSCLKKKPTNTESNPNNNKTDPSSHFARSSPSGLPTLTKAVLFLSGDDLESVHSYVPTTDSESSGSSGFGDLLADLDALDDEDSDDYDRDEDPLLKGLDSKNFNKKGLDSKGFNQEDVDDEDAPVVRGRWNNVTVDSLAFLKKPLEHTAAHCDLADRLGQGLALLRREKGGQILGVLADQTEPSPEHARAFLRGLAAPFAKSGLGSHDRIRGFFRRQLRHGAPGPGRASPEGQ